MDVTPIIDPLNDRQREAVTSPTEEPVLVLAGAGSGKTRVLTTRIAWLLERGVHPGAVVAFTFTNKAAREMRERVERLLGEGIPVWVATFHSTCVRILRRDIGHLGFERSFAIYDQADSLAAVKRVIRSLGLDDRSYPPRAIRAEIDRRMGGYEGPVYLLSMCNSPRTGGLFYMALSYVPDQNNLQPLTEKFGLKWARLYLLCQ